MADQVNERFEHFRSQFLADGYADPRQALAGLEGEAHAELSLLIEHFLLEAPRREWNEAEFNRSGAAAVSERVVAALSPEAADRSGERLKDLRDAAKISRASLVQRLAEALGLPGESERLGFYYHHMEQGTLPVSGVSDRVFEALAGVLRVGVGRLREAVAVSQREEGIGEPVFARHVTGTNREFEATDAETIQLALPDRPSEVDRLFTGG